MPRDHVSGRAIRARDSRADHAGACARAGLFAALGTVLAAFGHHAIAEGTVPWRLVGALVVAPFGVVWPLARRRYPAASTVGFTLVTQGPLHVALSYADGDPPSAVPGYAMHAGHLVAASRDGHAWHHAGAAMTTVHTAAALVVAWLLHLADARLTAAVGTMRVLAGAFAAALVQVLPRTVADTDALLPPLHGRRRGALFAVAAHTQEEVLQHAVVRRGPPRWEHLSVFAGPRTRGAGSPV